MNESVQLPDDAMLSVRGITKAFGSNSVLKGIDMDIAKGSVAIRQFDYTYSEV